MTATYEIVTLSSLLGATPAVLAGVEAHAASSTSTLLGCWFTEIGDLNKVLVLRHFESGEACAAERRAIASDTNPFGCADKLTGLSFETYALFPGLPVLAEGALGPVYEIRTYELQFGGLEPTFQAWAAAYEARNAFSPLAIALYSLEGTARITHIWPYESLEARAEARAASVQAGAWPPVDGPPWLKPAMRSQIFMPAAFSPLR